MAAGSSEENDSTQGAQAPEQVSDKIVTVPNLISLIRLCLVPVFFVVLLDGYDIAATLIFALAAGTDWIDGQIARRTHAVTKLGQLLDPAVDRILMISGVVGLLLVGRLPLWIILFVLIRDGLMLVGGAILLKRYHERIPVIFAGKAATFVLLTGFAGMLLNWPQIPGMGITDAAWMPGFNSDPVSWGIWFVYVGLLLSLVTGLYYLYAAYKKIRIAKARADGHSV